MTADEFITRWASSAASERANYQLFTTDLCALLEVPVPNPSGATEAAPDLPELNSRRYPFVSILERDRSRARLKRLHRAVWADDLATVA